MDDPNDLNWQQSPPGVLELLEDVASNVQEIIKCPLTVGNPIQQCYSAMFTVGISFFASILVPSGTGNALTGYTNDHPS